MARRWYRPFAGRRHGLGFPLFPPPPRCPAPGWVPPGGVTACGRRRTRGRALVGGDLVPTGERTVSMACPEAAA